MLIFGEVLSFYATRELSLALRIGEVGRTGPYFGLELKVCISCGMFLLALLLKKCSRIVLAGSR